jgi:hypothetical protein
LLISTLQWNWRKAQNSFCLEERGRRESEERGSGRRNNPNNVCTCE